MHFRFFNFEETRNVLAIETLLGDRSWIMNFSRSATRENMIEISFSFIAI